MWNIRKIVSKGDYLYAVVPEHPKAIRSGYVLHHRIVMENYLGRLLTENEVVHHIDHNKKNNSVANLEVMDYREHLVLHQSTGVTYVELVCPNCGVSFLKEKRNLHKNTARSKCSRKCNGEYSRKIQLGLI